MVASPKQAELTPSFLYSEAVGPVVNDLQAVLFCNGLYGLHVAEIAVDMDGMMATVLSVMRASIFAGSRV